jgi:hypothetical protein
VGSLALHAFVEGQPGRLESAERVEEAVWQWIEQETGQLFPIYVRCRRRGALFLSDCGRC